MANASLTNRYGEVTSEEWERRKDFAGFSDEDAELLSQLRPTAERWVDEVVEELYSHILQFQEIQDFFGGEGTLARVKSLQKQYFLGLTCGDYGDEYLASRLNVGRVHQRIGLEPQWYAGAYGVYVRLMLNRMFHSSGLDAATAQRTANALLKIIGLDQELATTVYATAHEAKVRELARQNEVIAAIGRTISQSLDIEDVYERFAEQVRKLVPFDRIVINSVDLEHATFTNLYVMGVDVRHLRPGEVRPLAGTQVGAVVHARAGQLVQPDARDALESRFPGLVRNFDAGLRSFMAVPLVSKDRIMGSLSLRSIKSNAYTDEDLTLAELVGDQIAGAIANAQLHAEQIRTDEALRESEKLYRSLYDHTPVMMDAMDRAGRLVNVNRHWLETLGYERGEVIGRQSTDFLTDSSRRYATEVALPEFWKTGYARDVEYQMVKKSGEVIDVLVSAVAEEDESGEAAQSLAFVVDVTQHRRLEEELHQAQKMESIGRLAGGVAHDFNNLLTAIINFTYLAIERSPEEGVVADYLKEAQNAALRAARVTRLLLAFSRRQIIEPAVVNLNDIMMDNNRMLRRLIDEDIELVTLADPELGLVKVDAGQIEQVLMNLAVNARDAMPDGGKLVIETANVSLDEEFARWHPETTAGEYIVLSVSDNGVGMTRETQTRAFEPFFTTKEAGKGTGLGLSTCYGIVRQSGGHIEVQSEPGQGTTFRICLPRVEEVPSTLSLRDETGHLPAGGETVLLVEDEPLVRDVTGVLLRARGYTVLEAANGTEAMRVATEHAGEAIHLLLTDVVMPLMGGAELAERVMEVHPETTVLYMSGYIDDISVRRRVVEKDGGVLQKPFTPESLAHRVRESLDQPVIQV